MLHISETEQDKDNRMWSIPSDPGVPNLAFKVSISFSVK